MRRSDLEREMDAELCFHIEAFAENLMRNGVPRKEAFRRARIEFDSVERVKEECLDARSLRLLRWRRYQVSGQGRRRGRGECLEFARAEETGAERAACADEGGRWQWLRPFPGRLLLRVPIDGARR
jgi:hypothetical protein